MRNLQTWATMDRETARLQELKRLLIVDSTEETAYDDIVRLAAGICGTPMALISLVDDSRQWFKATLNKSTKRW